MTFKNVLPTMAIAFAIYTFQACTDANAGVPQPSDERQSVLEAYPEVPREVILRDATLFDQLKERYKTHLSELNEKVSATGAKLVVMYMTPEVGESMTAVQRAGKPFIEQICQDMGIRYVDATTNLHDKNPQDITHMPVDGHFSKLGAQLIAQNLESTVTALAAHRSTATYEERPDMMGDQLPNQDEVLDGGKNLPYRLQTNTQGLRMDFDLAFPKTKQRILFMGDSGFFFPFLDNKDIASNVLQAKFEDKEFINACNWGYAIDDYISLFEQRAKFTEADVVFVQLSGTDILDMYFSHRNRFSRNPAAVNPSEIEKAFYEKAFKK
jgi:hypothetical protein